MNSLVKPRRIVDPGYRRWIKQKHCAFENNFCAGLIDPHHVKPQGGGITGGKVSDYRCMPLCRSHHNWAELNPKDFAVQAEWCRFEAQMEAFVLDYKATRPAKAPRNKQCLTLNVKSCQACGQHHNGVRFQIEEGKVRFWCRVKRNYFTNLKRRIP